MDRLRAALGELVDAVKTTLSGEPKSPVELLLDQHLPLDDEAMMSFPIAARQTTGIPTFVLNDLASRTNNTLDYPYILSRIWEILIDCQYDPNRMKKALNLLQYLLINGSIQVLKDCQERSRISFLVELSQDYNRHEFEQYQFSQQLDIGAGVRKTAAEISTLITDEGELLRTRRQAEQLHHSLSARGLRSSYPSAHAESPVGTSLASKSFHDEARPPMYSDATATATSGDDDIASKIVTHPPTPPTSYDPMW